MELIVFGIFITFIAYRIVYTALKGRYFESFLAAGVGILTTQIFLVANYAGEFFRESINLSANIALQGFGLFLIVSSAALLTAAFVSKRKISGIVSEWGSTKLFLAQGIYGIIRHPAQLAGILAALGVACMMANSAIIILALLAGAAFYVSAAEEDKHNALSLGSEYDEYAEAIPSFNLVAGLSKSLRNRRLG
ncbi:MAG: methyltransferase [Candidatus Aquicultor sp.]|nr:methyltransferase [Candidatus Aquicultor sp.]